MIRVDIGFLVLTLLGDELDVLVVEVLLHQRNLGRVVVATLDPLVDEHVGKQEGAVSAIHYFPAVSAVGEDGHYNKSEGADDEEELERESKHGVSWCGRGSLYTMFFTRT